ncbi:hypothetical protein Tco_1420687 [Tanacetum coccineum]
MFGTVPPISPHIGTNTGNPTSLNRTDPIPVDITNNMTTANVAHNVVNKDLPQLLDSKGGSHVTNVPAFDTLLANQKRYYKRSRRVGSAKKPIETKPKEPVLLWVTKVKAFMATAEEELYVGKNDARSGNSAVFIAKKTQRLLWAVPEVSDISGVRHAYQGGVSR